MGLYGIFGQHTQEACPLYNKANRKYMLKIAPTIEKNSQKYNVKMLHQFHSALEHTFLWLAEAENAQIIEELMSRTAGRFNTIRIVPQITFQTLLERLRKVEEGLFFTEDAQ